MNKQWIALVCGCVLLLSTLAGCQKTVPESDTVLGEAMEQQILADFGDAFAADDPANEYESADYIRENAEICSYMGQYNGYTALCIDGRKIWQTPSEWIPDPVAGYDFVHGSNSNRLVLYKDGTFVPLHDAYEQGIVTETDIQKMYERHSGKDSTTDSSYVETNAVITPKSDLQLDEATKQQIKKDYVLFQKQHNPDNALYQNLTVDSVIIDSYHGTYNGCIALFIREKGQVFADIQIEETIAGYPFKYGSSYIMSVYKDGEFADVADAYEQGWLTKEDIKAIAKPGAGVPVSATPTLMISTTASPNWKPISYKVGYSNEVSPGDELFNHIAVIQTYAELQALHQTDNVLNRDGVAYTQGYDEDFFADKSLVVVCYETGSISYPVSIENVTKNAHQLCVHIKTVTNVAGFCAMAEHRLVIEIPKTDLQGVTETLVYHEVIR